MDYKKEIALLIKKQSSNSVKDQAILSLIEIPPPETKSDYAFPCFTLTKLLKKSPNIIASDLASSIRSTFLEKIEAKGAYVNFNIKKELLIKDILERVIKEKHKYGMQQQKKRIVIEFPAPNTNKPLHLGHVRNICLGQSITNIEKFLGNTVFPVNLNNDRGVHICKSMYAYKKYSNNKQPDKKSDHFVGDFYVLYSKNETPETEAEIQKMLLKWEQNDKEIHALWKKMNSWAIKGFEETYKKFNVKFAKTYNESEFYNKGKEIVYDALKKGIFIKSDEGIVADLSDKGLGKKVVLRADGTSIYITQDIYLATQKYKDFKYDKSIYVVGSEQNYHFKVLFIILEKLALPYASNCHHLSYGMVYLPEGKMKSREGTVVDADDLVEKMTLLAKEEILKRHPELPLKEIEKRSHAIGMAALRFMLIKIDPAKDIYFDPKAAISFQGETGPYLQYTYARISSVFRKLNKQFKPSLPKKYSILNEDEIKLIKMLEQFQNVVLSSGERLKPNILCTYLFELCQHYNTWYDKYPILQSELREIRLLLSWAVQHVLKQGMQLLEIIPVEEM